MTQPIGNRMVFAHAMWRSGSTYLASRFAASDQYRLFYEPFHEGIGRKPSAKRTLDRARVRDLRHPEIEGGYFGSYEGTDPVSGSRLADLFPPSASVRDVYNDACDGTLAYLAALERAATAEGKMAFFGFCRAGTQSHTASVIIGGRNLHLWRDPRDQFASYGWPANEYFMTGTLLQLGYSARFVAVARDIAPAAFRSPFYRLATRLPDGRTRWKYRIARRAASALSPTESYGLFYLSWLISFAAAQANAEYSFSLCQINSDLVLRHRIEAAYGISFDGLTATRPSLSATIAYAAIERDVAARVTASTGMPVSVLEYPPAALTSA